MRDARQDEAQAVVKIVRRNIINLIYADNTILVAESEEEIEKGRKRILKKVKEESEKVGLNLTFKRWRSWHPVPLLDNK